MVTHERLLEVLRYEPDEGRFYWIKQEGRGIKRSKNGQAGSFDAHGYGQVVIDGKIYKEHRLVWFYIHGEWPTSQIDHVNHARRDNRIENLRLVDNAENHRNRPKQRNNKTGTPGVWYDPRGFYAAYINVDGKRIDLGNHKTIEGAREAREAANEKYGYHSNHGVGIGIGKIKRLPNGCVKKNSVFIEINGRRMQAEEWSKQPGCTVSAGIIRSRMGSGWEAEDAVFAPFVTRKMAAEKRTRLPNGSFAPKEYKPQPSELKGKT